MTVAVLWFRKSLRLHDNEALTWACSSDEVDSILPIFIFEEEDLRGERRGLGFNRLSFISQSLRDLDSRLNDNLGLRLRIFSGNYLEVLGNIREHLEGEKICLAYEYCSEPRLRNSEVILRDWSRISDDFKTKAFPAGHTLLDIEEVVGYKEFKKPKSMKDMEIIFRKHLDVNSLCLLYTSPSPRDS